MEKSEECEALFEEAFGMPREEYELDLFEYWLKMPSWEPYDAIFLLAFRIDPRMERKEQLYLNSLVMNVDHFKYFGLVEDYSIELDGIHIIGDKRPPREWIDCYLKDPCAGPLPEIVLRHMGQSTTNGRDHVSDRLAILNQAAHKWWANARKDDSTSHPRKPDVIAWLMERGFSKITADSGATIIRPEWASKGRRPEE